METTSTPAAMRDHLAAYVRTVWNEGGLDRVEEFLHPDYRLLDPYEGVLAKTIDGLVSVIELWRRMFVEPRMSVLETVAEDQVIAWRWNLDGEMRTEALVGLTRALADEVPGLRQISMNGISISRFREGRIVEDITVSDFLSLAEQVGYLQR